MAESDDLIKVFVADNEILTVVRRASLSETSNCSLFQLATTTCVSMEDCGYLRVISDARIPDEMPITTDKSESDSDSEVTDIDTLGQCVQKQQCQDSNSATYIGMYMTAIDDIDDHGYAIVIADSDLTDSHNIASEVRTRIKENCGNQLAIPPVFLPNNEHQTESNLSPIYMPNEMQATSSSVYLDPSNVDTDPDPSSFYADPKPYSAKADPDPDSVYADPYIDSAYTDPDRDSVYTNPDPDLTYSHFISYETEAPLDSGNTNRRHVVTCLVILVCLLFGGIVSITIVYFTPTKTIDKQMSTGIGHFHSSPFQLYNIDPVVQVQPTNRVIFNRNLLPDAGAYNQSLSSGVFRAPKTGLYWFHLETHTDREGRANYSLVDGHSNERLTALSSNCSELNLPTLSRDDLRSLNESNQLCITSTYAAYALINNAHAVAWSGFELDEILGASHVAFSVANSSLIGRGPVLQFSTVLVDTNDTWDLTNSGFVAPVDGVYVLSVNTIALLTLELEVLRLIFGTRTVLYNRGYFSPTHVTKSIICKTNSRSPGTTTVSFTIVVRLKQNQYVQVHCQQYNLNIDRRWDSFKGFLYAPFLVEHNVIWSLDARTVLNLDKSYAQFAVYDYEALLTGITVTNRTHLIIPVGGIYYVTLTTQYCAPPTQCCTAGLYANNNMLFKTNSLKFNSLDCFLHNHAVLLPLQQNDALYVVILEGSFSFLPIGSYFMNNLSGFLVYAT